jgi:hypothetical protein
VFSHTKTICFLYKIEPAIPTVRVATGFHRDLGRRQLLEEGDHPGAAQVRAQYRPSVWSTPYRVKTAWDVSMATRLYWVMDGSGFGS